MLSSDFAYFIRRLREILVLAKDDRNIILVAMGQANDVDCDPDVNAIFFAEPYGVIAATGQLNPLSAIAAK